MRMDNKSAQGKLARRLARLGKAHGFQKIDGEYQRRVNDVGHLFDQSRFWRQPEGSYTFDVQIKVFSPGFHKRVHGQTGNPIYYSQIQTSLLKLMGYHNGEVWTSEDADRLSMNLDDLERRFVELALPFFDGYNVESRVVEAYRAGGPLLRKTRVFTQWELDVYEGRATLEQRPVPVWGGLEPLASSHEHTALLFPDF